MPRSPGSGEPDADAELAIVSKALGHANLSTTADVYSNFTRAMQERAAARMDAILDVG